MEFSSRYTSRQPDEQGYVIYSQEENNTWSTLYERQIKLLPGNACDEFHQGLALLDLNPDAIPQLPEISQKLYAATQWKVTPVPALIPAATFFTLLSKREFPAATFIRLPDSLDYVEEPDIFHELFGHCPLLTDPVYADFLQGYALTVLEFPESDWPLLQRLFWFTVEFGLILTEKGLRAYGGGILSSIAETPYSIYSNEPRRMLFNVVNALRTPYRIDMKQKNYFVIQNFSELYAINKTVLTAAMKEARDLGEFVADFLIDKENPSVHIGFC